MILVTGGAGYIGAHTNKALNQAGYETVVVDNLSKGYENFVKWGHFENYDFGSKDLREVFEKYDIDGVLHFGAFSSVAESVELPQKYFKNNYKNTINLNEPIDDTELLEEWLSDLRGNKVYIKVPMKGVKLRLVNMAQKNAEIIKHQKKAMENSLIELKKYLKLDKLPRIIEGYDISNISGKFAVGSKVSFKDAKPNKKKYKRFKIETPGPNDFAMMKELLTRRLKMIDTDEEPDLIVIDGGKGQLGMACEVLDELNLVHIPIIGLAKEFEEIYIPNSKRPIIIPKNNKALHLLQQVRDESHRFAITYHRKLRSDNISESSLDDIPGIGKKRKINILKEFGTMDKVKNASVEELAKIKGMNEKVATNVYEYYH